MVATESGISRLGENATERILFSNATGLVD